MATTDAVHPHLRTQPAARDEAVPSAAVAAYIPSLVRFVAALTVLLAAAAFPRSAFFTIHEITVAGTRHVAGGDVVALSGLRPGMPLFALPAREIAARVAQHPRIASAYLQLLPPDRARIRVVERIAVAAFPYRGGVVLLDRVGVVMDWQPEPDGLPLILADETAVPWMRPGHRLPVAAVVRTLEALQHLPADIVGAGTRLRMDAAGNLSLITTDGIMVWLGHPRGLAERAAVLPQVLAAVRRQPAGVEYLDVRFHGSIVFKPRPAATTKGGVGP